MIAEAERGKEGSMATELLEHIPDPSSVIAEIVRRHRKQESANRVSIERNDVAQSSEKNVEECSERGIESK